MRIVLLIRASSDTTIPEVSIVHAVLSFLEAPRDLYRDYSLPPYTPTPYMPLFYFATAAVSIFLGPSVENTYLAGRLVSFSSFSASLTLVYLIARKLRVDRASAILSVFLAGGTLIVIPWAASCRPDFLALFLSLLGIYLVSSDGGPSKSKIYVAGAAWSLALFTKQLFFAAPLAFLIITARRQRLSTVAAPLLFFSLINAVVFISLNIATNGLFFRNILVANLADPSFEDIPALIIRCLFPEFLIVLLLGAAGFLTHALLHYRHSNAATRDAEPYLGRMVMLANVISLLVFSLAVCKPGAAENYFYEPLFLSAILASIAFNRVRNAKAVSWRMFALVMLTGLWATYRSLDRGLVAHVRNSLTRPPSAYFEYLVLSTPGDILFISNGFGLRSGRGTTLYDGFNASYLSARGEIDLSPIARKIESQSYSALLLQRDETYYGYRVTPARLEEAIDRYYHEAHNPCRPYPTRNCSGFRWLTPRPSGVLPPSP